MGHAGTQTVQVGWQSDNHLSRGTIGMLHRFGLVAAGALCVAGQAVSQNTWSQYQGDSGHTGSVDEVVQASFLEQIWSVTPQDYGHDRFIQGVSTDGTKVYLSSKINSASFSPHELIALDAATGQAQWSQEFLVYSHSGISAPSVSNGLVYIHDFGHSSSSNTEQPTVHGINAADGTIEFSTTHSGQFSSGSRIAVSGSQIFSAGGYHGGLDAYDSTTGAHEWFADVNQQYGWIPAVDSQRVYVYMGGASASPGPMVGTLYAFNRQTGAREWAIQNPDDTFRINSAHHVTIGDDNVFAVADGDSGVDIVAYSKVNGEIQWRQEGIFSTGGMAVDDGLIYANNRLELAVLSQSTGDILRSWDAPGDEILFGNNIVLDNVVFTQTDAATYALDKDSLSQVWSVDLTGELSFSNGTLYISGREGLHAFAVPTPGSALAAGAGLAACASRRRRRSA